MTAIDPQLASVIRVLDLSRQRLLAGTKVGDVLAAKVAAVVSENRVVLNIKDVAITVLTRIPLRTGQQLNLQIAGTEGEITLKPVQAAPANESRVPASVLAPPDDSRAAARFVETFAKSPIHDLPEGESPRIQRVVERIAQAARNLGVDVTRLSEPAQLERVLARLGVKVAPRPEASVPIPTAKPAAPVDTPAAKVQTAVETAPVDRQTPAPAKAPVDAPTPAKQGAVPVDAAPTASQRPIASQSTNRSAAAPPEPVRAETPPEGVRPSPSKPAPEGARPSNPNPPVVSSKQPAARAETPVRQSSAPGERSARPETPQTKPDAPQAVKTKTAVRSANSRVDSTAPRVVLRAGVRVAAQAGRASVLAPRVSPDPSAETAARVLSQSADGEEEAVRSLRDAPRGLEAIQRDAVRAIRSEGHRLIDRQPRVGAQDLGDLLSTVKQLGQHVERMGMLNHLAGDDRPLYLEIPFWAQGEVRTMKIRLHDRRKVREENDEGRPMRMDLFFDLAEMGRVRADVLYVKGGLSVRFFAENRDAVEMVQSDLTELSGALDAEGVRVDTLSVEHRVAADPQLEAIGDVVTLTGADRLSMKG